MKEKVSNVIFPQILLQLYKTQFQLRNFETVIAIKHRKASFRIKIVIIITILLK